MCADLEVWYPPEDADGIIECCYELVCLGRPLPEILDEAKRLTEQGKRRKLDIAAELADAEVFANEPGEVRSPCRTRVGSETLHVPVPTDPSSQVHQSQTSSNPLTRLTGFKAAGGVQLLDQPLPLAAHIATPSGVSFPAIIRGSPFSLITGICILALFAATTSPVMRSSAKGAPAITLGVEPAVLSPNSTSQQSHGQTIDFVQESPGTSTSAGIFSIRDLAFGASGPDPSQRNAVSPEVLRPNPRPKAPHGRS
jgi:hypothetical protein